MYMLKVMLNVVLRLSDYMAQHPYGCIIPHYFNTLELNLCIQWTKYDWGTANFPLAHELKANHLILLIYFLFCLGTLLVHTFAWSDTFSLPSSANEVLAVH
jgi:hypothetical protein